MELFEDLRIFSDDIKCFIARLVVGPIDDPFEFIEVEAGSSSLLLEIVQLADNICLDVEQPFHLYLSF
jgi:hypothetical protein